MTGLRSKWPSGNKNRYLTLSSFQVIIGWVVFLSFAILTVAGPYHTSMINYVYDQLDSARYSAFAPIIWCMFVSWGLLTSHYGYAGWFGEFLSWKGFKVFTRISYALYLTQFPVFFYNVGTTKTVSYYSPFDMFNFGELGTILLVSTILTLAIDLPFQNVQKIIWPRPATISVEYKDVRSSDYQDDKQEIEYKTE